MKKVMTELHLAQSAIAVNAIADSSAYTMADYQGYILNKYGVGKDRFINSVKYYTAHPELMKEVYDSVLFNLTKIQAGTN